MMTQEQFEVLDGRFLALTNISATLLGEIALIKASLTRRTPETHKDEILNHINSQTPGGLASIEDKGLPFTSKGYEYQVEIFTQLVREAISFS